MPKTSRWTPIVLLLLASVALFIRTAGLQATGVGGNDTILYYSLAEQWLEGNPVYRIANSAEVFRPVLLAYNALSLKLLGHSDYAIKLANAVVDSLNVLLVAFVAWLLSRLVVVEAFAGLPGQCPCLYPAAPGNLGGQAGTPAYPFDLLRAPGPGVDPDGCRGRLPAAVAGGARGIFPGLCCADS
jgi:hypothetical protein